MDDEASAKVAELVARLKGILEELRQLDDPDWLLCHDMRIC